MSEELPKGATETGSQSREGEPSSLSVPDQKAEAQLSEIIRELPPEQAKTTLREVVFGIIERGASPKLDSEVIKIAAASVDKENENKFRFLTQKENNKAEQDTRAHTLKEKELDLKVRRWDSQVKMLWPVLISVIILVMGCIATGIYLAATGHETLGFCILSATISGVFAFLGGLGTAHFFKHE